MQFIFSSNLLKKMLEITISIIDFYFAVFYNSLTVTNETLHIVLLLWRHRIKHKMRNEPGYSEAYFQQYWYTMYLIIYLRNIN